MLVPDPGKTKGLSLEELEFPKVPLTCRLPIWLAVGSKFSLKLISTLPVVEIV